MKSKWRLIASVFQLVIGILGIFSFLVLGLGGQPVAKWTVTLILCTLYVGFGIFGIIDYKSGK